MMERYMVLGYKRMLDRLGWLAGFACFCMAYALPAHALTLTPTQLKMVEQLPASEKQKLAAQAGVVQDQTNHANGPLPGQEASSSQSFQENQRFLEFEPESQLEQL
ncbi:MAG: hypothetical protein D6722_23035, partial [Bacteroidetes bacterium]